MSADHPLIRMLAAFDARVRDLCAMLGDASPSIAQADIAADPHRDAHADALRRQAARRIWFAAPVPLDAFIQPGNRIALVAPEMLRPLLAARALFGCRDAVRRCVDRHTRRTLLEGVGPTALAALAEMPASRAGGADVLPDDTSPDALARRGWQMIAASGACRNTTLCHVVELGLASVSDEASPAAGLARHGAAADEPLDAESAHAAAHRDEMERFFNSAGRMFPELQWLFG